MFSNREDAGLQLAKRLQPRKLNDPLVLGIPRGGVITAAVLARELGGELDVVLSRKLRAPHQHELAIGAIGEDGEIYLNSFAWEIPGVTEDYIAKERDHQIAEIERRSKLFRAVKPPARVTGRSVIVTDDGIATGSTMLAALHVLNAQKPHETILAIPVAPPDALEQFRPLCTHLECLLAPSHFAAVGQFYEDFCQVEDDEVVRLLREFQAAHSAKQAS
ncbi:MAG: phosphoribosyltransferase [Betaproteobacteria bacterium]|nr:phosphoribosyltransferase [Betaproteobacteria bacterium]